LARSVGAGAGLGAYSGALSDSALLPSSGA